jgi:antitoxin (DNA-binding transcriptional repressor) of toxin-antitoxin stability system
MPTLSSGGDFIAKMWRQFYIPYLRFLTRLQGETIMFHMKAFSVRDLRQRFPDVEARLKRGETVVVRKRQKVIGRIVPEPPKLLQYPDFEKVQKEIFGNNIMPRTFTELLREERDRY